MTDNEKIAQWQNKLPMSCCRFDNFYDDDCKNESLPCFKPIIIDGVGKVCEAISFAGTPDYQSDDAAAMSLLDTAVDKGYLPELLYLNCKYWQCEIWKGKDLHGVGKEPTRVAAVVAAVLQLIADKP